MLLLDTNILIDVLRGEAPALAWLEQQQRPRISVISWIEVLVGCREGESGRVQAWLDTFPCPSTTPSPWNRCGYGNAMA